ncbi:MAG: glycosyl transferase, partial [Gammaproteobacteria bacterium HGW-Gammaproteobacteria-7]
MSRLKVIQLVPALDAGGVERSTLEIAAALVAAGHDAVVISAGGRMVPELLATGARHVQLDIGRKSLSTLFKVRRLRQLIAGADIVHARSRLPAWLAWLAMRKLDSPPHWVNTVHGLNSPGRYSRILTWGDRVICVSQSVRRHLLAHYPDLDSSRLEVIERGIDPDIFRRAQAPPELCRERYRAEFPELIGGRLLCLPGRGTRLKGHQAAIELLVRLRARGVDARLLMVGVAQDGRSRYLAQLRRLARQRGVDAWLAFSPPRDDMQALYAA